MLDTPLTVPGRRRGLHQAVFKDPGFGVRRREESFHLDRGGTPAMKHLHMAASAISLSLVVILLPGSSSADPCKAIPDRGPFPAYLSRGAKFTGSVVYVGDGDSMCVAVGEGPQNWVEVRLEDFYAPELNEHGGKEAKIALERIAMGRRVECTAGHRTYDRVTAMCAIGHQDISQLLRVAGTAEGGRGKESPREP
jgi:micrococcal nuclease